ncbi:hypothetical protein AMTRI_Chr05g70760 [Amborella trichopoda]
MVRPDFPRLILGLPLLTEVEAQYCKLLRLPPNSSLLVLVSLEHLGLSRNDLQHWVPYCIAKLSKLHVLDVSYNQLNGTLQEIIENLSMLHVLDVSANQLSGMVPENIGYLSICVN